MNYLALIKAIVLIILVLILECMVLGPFMLERLSVPNTVIGIVLGLTCDYLDSIEVSRVLKHRIS